MHIRSENGVEQERSVTVITESGLYAAILKSRRPEAKAFRRWVTSEVLPTIRKHGVYVTDEVAKEEPADIMAKAILVAKEQ
nr:BRO family protein [Corynebacterium ulcerans]